MTKIKLTESQLIKVIERVAFEYIVTTTNNKLIFESIAFNENVIEKFKETLRSGLVTAAVVTALLSASFINAQEKHQIKDLAVKYGINVVDNSTNFWGMKDGKYTNDYLNKINVISNDSTELNKVINLLKSNNINYVTNKNSFIKYATDKKIGPLHSLIKKYIEDKYKLPNNNNNTRKNNIPDYNGSYITPYGMVKSITQSEYNKQIKLNPKFGHGFETDGVVK